MTNIAQIVGREILDSRGNPTIEVDVHLEGGGFRTGGRSQWRKYGEAPRRSSYAMVEKHTTLVRALPKR